MKNIRYLFIPFILAISVILLSACYDRFSTVFPCGLINNFDAEVKPLNLTKEQQAKYESIKKDIQDDMKTYMEKIRAAHEYALKALSEPNPDVNKIATDIKTNFLTETNPALKTLDYFTKFYNALDATQQKTLLEKIKAETSTHMQGQGKCTGTNNQCPYGCSYMKLNTPCMKSCACPKKQS